MKDVKFSWGCIGAGSALLLFIAALANNVRHDTHMAGAADAGALPRHDGPHVRQPDEPRRE